MAASPSDLDAIEKALKQQLASVHPDTTSGNFVSDGQKERYLRLAQGLEFIQSRRTGSLAIRTTDLSAIVEETVRALQKIPREPPKARAAILEVSRREIRRASRTPKITSATLFAGTSAVFTFIGSLKEHPLLSGWATRPWFLWMIGALWVASGVAFARVWLKEQIQEREVEIALGEEALQSAFRAACWHARQNRERRFSRDEVVQSLVTYRSPSPFALRRHGHKVKLSAWLKWVRAIVIPAPKIGEDDATEIAAFYVARWIDRGAVTRSAFRDAIEWFEIDPAVLERHK